MSIYFNFCSLTSNGGLVLQKFGVLFTVDWNRWRFRRVWLYSYVELYFRGCLLWEVEQLQQIIQTFLFVSSLW